MENQLRPVVSSSGFGEFDELWEKDEIPVAGGLAVGLVSPIETSAVPVSNNNNNDKNIDKINNNNKNNDKNKNNNNKNNDKNNKNSNNSSNSAAPPKRERGSSKERPPKQQRNVEEQNKKAKKDQPQPSSSSSSSSVKSSGKDHSSSKPYAKDQPSYVKPSGFALVLDLHDGLVPWCALRDGEVVLRRRREDFRDKSKAIFKRLVKMVDFVAEDFMFYHLLRAAEPPNLKLLGKKKRIRFVLFCLISFSRSCNSRSSKFSSFQKH